MDLHLKRTEFYIFKFYFKIIIINNTMLLTMAVIDVIFREKKFIITKK